VVSEVVKKLTIPVSVKLSSFYSNPLNLVRRMDNAGVKGFVLFNRLFQPDIDTSAEKQAFPLRLSSPGYHRLPLRFTGLFYGNIKADICSSSGIFYGNDIVKLILAGANCVQCVSALYKNGISHIGSMLDELAGWMKQKGYNSLKEFRGKLSMNNLKDPFAYQRAQYVDLLMEGRPVIKESFKR
jgi:dihydroorotate dehydrogenase (fumarate)